VHRTDLGYTPTLPPVLESSGWPEIPSRSEGLKNLDTKIRETKGLGARRFGLRHLRCCPPDRHGLDHDRASLMAAQGQMSHGGCGDT
jgi:hypothetical protein